MINPRWLLLSASLHGAIFLFWHAFNQTPPEPTPVNIEIIEQQKPTPRRGRSKNPGAGQKSLQAYLPKADRLWHPKQDGEYNQTYVDARGSSEWPSEAWGSSGSDFAQIQHLGQFDRLMREIQGLLNYPGILGRRGLQGTINARLYFGVDSKCEWKRTRVSGPEAHLRIYILSLLNKLCSFESVQNLSLQSKAVDLSFQFAISEFARTRDEQNALSRVNGNVLSFYRAFPESKIEWKLGPIRGVWFAPVVFLDPAWIVENWETYVEGKDPLREFRDTQ